MDRILAQGAVWPGAVGVSGGADSLALMFLLADWTAAGGLAPPVVLTVDHGLQPGSKQVAEGVAARARRHGMAAHVLRWTGRKPGADIEKAARDARYRLMGDWCRRNGIGCVFVAHSMDDQAETFLLRLMRGSGVDGLAAMAPVAPFPARDCENLRLARPLLRIPRAKLRGFLASRGEAWFEDEMNADRRFARVRLREDWPTLREMGFSAQRIATAAGHLARARTALDRDTQLLLQRASRMEGKAVLLDADAIAAAPEEIGLRALSRVLMQVSGQIYRPRFDRLEQLLAAIRYRDLRGGRTLHGCCIRPASKRLACFGPRTLSVTPEAGRGGKKQTGSATAGSFIC
ncbi:MAG TPA: tRNA lysidine(34) synthetase TilS [Rhizomicrobium sp.]|nr:tRNA lysidine(34) synthetase TilS [Rhizomicrobium sp.]